ncbi:hypothetical protein D3C86_1233150 [compost metagenome]
MTTDQTAKSIFQTNHINGTFQTKQMWHIVSQRIAVQLIKQVHPLLSRRQPVISLLCSFPDTLIHSPGTKLRQLSQPPDGRVVENIFQSKSSTHFLADLIDQVHSFQRMPAQFKETAVPANQRFVYSKYRRPDLCQLLFNGSCRRNMVGFQLYNWLWQQFHIQLPVGSQRKRRQFNIVRWMHIIG